MTQPITFYPCILRFLIYIYESDWHEMFERFNNYEYIFIEIEIFCPQPYSPAFDEYKIVILITKNVRCFWSLAGAPNAIYESLVLIRFIVYIT